MGPKDDEVIEHITEALDEYEAYLIEDHKLATEGLAIEVARRRTEQNGD